MRVVERDPQTWIDVMTPFAVLRIFDHTPNPELRRQLTDTWRQLHVARDALYGAILLRAFRSLEEHDNLIGLIATGAAAFVIESEARAHSLRAVAAGRHVSRAASRVQA